PEAALAKALDKIETLIQHNQGKNPEDFDYRFNLDYGRNYTDALELTQRLRAEIDKETQQHASRQAPPVANVNTVEVKAFIPAVDFNTSKQFYTDLGFTKASDEGGIAYFFLSNCSFLLQQVPPEHSHPLMMHLLVENIDDWHQQVVHKRLEQHYGIQISDPVTRPWGMREFMLSDPGGTQWRIAQNV
ncbi:MAG: VOC family protein, partial [Pseudomonadota bacterium]